MIERNKKIRISPVKADERTQTIWLSKQTNDKLKAVKEELNFAAMEDVMIYLMEIYDKWKQAQKN